MHQTHRDQNPHPSFHVGDDARSPLTFPHDTFAHSRTTHVPGGWFTSVLQSVVHSGQPLTFQDAAGGSFVVLTEQRYRTLVSTDPAHRAVEDGNVVLTPREREVIGMVSQGLAASTIAEQLGLAQNTVAQHLTSVRRTFGVRSSAAAAAMARRQGLIA